MAYVSKKVQVLGVNLLLHEVVLKCMFCMQPAKVPVQQVF